MEIAVVRLDKIGDLILTTPAIASLRAAYPKAKITAIVSPYNKVVLEGSSLVDAIWEWRWTLSNVLRLRKSKFELVAVFSPTTVSYAVAFFSGAKIRAGYVYANRILPRLFTLFALNRRVVSRIVPHEVTQTLDVIKKLGIPSDDRLKIELSDEAIAWAKASIRPGQKIGIHYSNHWDSKFFIDLISCLKPMAELVITHGPSERPPNIAIQTFGNLTFRQWAVLTASCTLFISPNTGAMHLAASQGVPVIAVFESKSADDDETRWHPWKVPYRIFRKNDPKLLDEITGTARQWLKKN